MLPTARTSYVLLIVAAFVALLSFSITGPYSMRIDGEIYIGQVEQFTSGVLVLEPFDVALRAFKPFYGVWGAILSPLFSPYEALQLLNLFFLFGLPFASYVFLREFGFCQREATIGSIWIATGYPLLKYGLAISTDIGAWFAATLTAALVLRGVRLASPMTLVAASVIGFLGGAIKEPGVAGLLFGGLYILLTAPGRTWQKTILFLGALALPALLLEGALLYTLTKAGFPSFLDWFLLVRTSDNLESFHTFGKFLGVFGSSFNVLVLFACCGVVALFKKVKVIPQLPQKVIALALATLPVLLWTFFISRIFYVQFLYMVPLALLGLMYLMSKFSAAPTWIWVGLYGAPIIVSVLLYAIAGTRSLFSIFG